MNTNQKIRKFIEAKETYKANSGQPFNKLNKQEYQKLEVELWNLLPSEITSFEDKVLKKSIINGKYKVIAVFTKESFKRANSYRRPDEEVTAMSEDYKLSEIAGLDD